MPIIKYEVLEILSPTMRAGLPCPDKICTFKACRKRAIVCVPRNQRVVFEQCSNLSCKNRIGRRKFIDVTFCEKNKCKHLDTKNVRCSLVPRHSGRLAFGRAKGTLRMHAGTSEGWHYRKFA